MPNLSPAWPQAVSDIVHQYFIARTEGRYKDLSFRDYLADGGTKDQRKRFYKAWTSSVEDLHYRLRSARTQHLFREAFTQMICAHSYKAMREEFPTFSELLLSETGWEDLRDILMLSVSARSYIKPSQEEN